MQILRYLRRLKKSYIVPVLSWSQEFSFFGMVPVPAPEKIGPRKKYRYRSRRKVQVPVSEKIIGVVTLWHIFVNYIPFPPFLCNSWYIPNKLVSARCHCNIGGQTFVLRHSQVFHVLATWGVETGDGRAEKSQAVRAVTAMTGGG